MTLSLKQRFRKISNRKSKRKRKKTVGGLKTARILGNGYKKLGDSPPSSALETGKDAAPVGMPTSTTKSIITNPFTRKKKPPNPESQMVYGSNVEDGPSYDKQNRDRVPLKGEPIQGDHIIDGQPVKGEPLKVSMGVPLTGKGEPIQGDHIIDGQPVKGEPLKVSMGVLLTGKGKGKGEPVLKKTNNTEHVLTRDTCHQNLKSIPQLKEDLTKIGITSFGSKEEAKKATTSDMQKYDKIAKKTQLFENAVRLLHIVGCAVPLVSSLAEVTLAVVTGVSNFNKSKALTHLASMCLSYVSNISRDLAEMFTFYDNDLVKKKEIILDQALYDILKKNLYTFFYFLIDSINFEINASVGSQHYIYWYSFMQKVDFNKYSDYNKAIPSNRYRYSCKECIPNATLREKMRTTLDTNLVTLDNPKKSVYQKGVGMMSMTSKTQPDDLLGFCNEEYLALCKNYNDNIMRLIELKMYILINSAYSSKPTFRENSYIPDYTQKSFIPILRYSEKTEKDLSEEFKNAVFSTTKISDTQKKEFEKKFRIAEFSGGKSFIPDLELSFKFLIELNRIISELEYPPFNPKKGSKLVKGMTGVINLITKPAKVFFSTPKLQHEELMREYTLMTGNFLMMTSRYALDYNKLSVVDKERVHIQLTKKLESVDGALKVVETQLSEGARSVGDVAETLNGDIPEAAEAPLLGGGRRNLSKKVYRKSKKYKTKHKKRRKSAL